MSGPVEPIDPNGDPSGARPPAWSPPAPPSTWAPPAYPPQSPAPAPVAVDDRTRRFAQRPLPLAGGAIAGAGIALAVFGVIIWGGNYAITGGSGAFGGGTRNALGIVLSLVVVALGYIVVATTRTGPLATAGVAASALGVPTVLGFITLDLSSGTPIDLNVVFIGSILIWVFSYLVMPGARGHGFYVGLSGIALWIYLVIKIEPNLFALPFLAAERTFLGPDSPVSDPTRHLDALAAVSLILGALYYVSAFALDESERAGAATPFVVAGFPALLGGVLFAANAVNLVGTGILLIVIGAALAMYGARARRRFTSWIWAAAMAVGVILEIGKALPDNDAAAGAAFVVVGVVLVLIGVAVSAALSEREYPNH